MRKLSEAEQDALPLLARGAALRFLLTRLVDWLNVPPGALVKPKDPLEYVRKLRFHQSVASVRDYGADAVGAGGVSELPHVTIYTDGACSGNPGPGGWGAILKFGDVEKELKGGEAHTTNNRMELMAAISALEALKRPCMVDLNTDSQYVRQGITGWIHGWKRNGWRTADKKPVKNVELWQRARCRAEAARGALALGQGPRRPRRERARRSAGARGRRDGAVEAEGGGVGARSVRHSQAVIARRNARAHPVRRGGCNESRRLWRTGSPALAGHDSVAQWLRAASEAYSCPSSVSPPETSTLPGAGSRLSFLTTPSSTSIE